MDELELPAQAREQIERVRALDREAAAIVARVEERVRMLQEDAERIQTQIERDRKVFQALVESGTGGSDLLARAWADYEKARASTVSVRLRGKQNAAPKAADALRESGKHARELRRQAKYYEWIVALYEASFPWLKDLRDEDEGLSFLAVETDPGVPSDEDPVRHWLSPEEWKQLGSAERSQRALDRYRASRKTAWQVGRDYERYVGYLREQDGWAVHYQGIVAGFDDLGRDLVCSRGSEVEVVQCKRWSRHKTIHEKHVFQLFGTVVAARIDDPDRSIRGTFVTTTSLSDRARAFADQLNIAVTEEFPLADYPVIKCNVSRTGEQIYHLPFDQQYDNTAITPSRGEIWALTAQEAEDAGFRRARRWRGERPEG